MSVKRSSPRRESCGYYTPLNLYEHNGVIIPAGWLRKLSRRAEDWLQWRRGEAPEPAWRKTKEAT